MKKVIDFLSSMQLAIYLLLILLVITILGTVIPQGQPLEFYSEKYPEVIVNLIGLLLLNDVYHSLYFYGLAVFLVASLLTCTIRRFNKIISVFKPKKSIREDEVRNAGVSVELDVKAGSEEIATAARKAGYRSNIIDGRVYATRNRWARMGEVLVHFGLILLVAAGVGWSLGEVVNIALFEGQTIMLPDELDPEIELTCIEVNQENDPNTGAIIDYKTKVSISKPGSKTKEIVMEVNKPLEYGGIRFYQSEMSIGNQAGLVFSSDLLPPDFEPEMLSSVSIHWRLGNSEGDGVARIGEMLPLGDTGYVFLLREYFDRFMVDENGVSNTNPEKNPTIIWAVADEAVFIAQGFSFADSPEYDIVKLNEEMPGLPNVSIKFLEVPPGLPDEGHTDYVITPGTVIPLGGSRFQVDYSMEETGGAHSATPPSANPVLLLTDKDTGEELPFLRGERMGLITADGSSYMIRFMGEGTAPYSGLTASKDPGLGIFYAGAIVLTLGVIVAMLFRHETIMFFPISNKLLVGGRTNKGNDMFVEKFDGKVQKIIAQIKRGSDA
ncbi:MAG: cytochrome c biogenesis protein ResB [bacterium]|nr:cytochrome c biogenesis protein ResB [bacterium]